MVITMSMPIKPGQTDRIRTLNDDLRQNLLNAHAVITNGVAALGPDAVARIMKTIEVYDDFCHANDPCQYVRDLELDARRDLEDI